MTYTTNRLRKLLLVRPSEYIVQPVALIDLNI